MKFKPFWRSLSHGNSAKKKLLIEQKMITMKMSLQEKYLRIVKAVFTIFQISMMTSSLNMRSFL